ncbi:UDP-glycosyltransferase 76B1-like [Euphorbia lathyris]|uniref:UDP-glycosyltransferase 76B1-like n=1 Tax=Euphorbia lathyris TaxID=212925 RepID=UPI00331371E8
MEILAESHSQKKKSRRLLLFPLPLEGHMNPMLHLAKILYSEGFSITILHTNFNSPNPSDHPYFTFCSIPEGLSETEAATYDEDVIATVSAMNVRCADPFRDCLANLLSGDLKEPVACLITDAVWDFIGAVAASFKLPWIALPTSNISSFLFCDAYPYLRDKGYMATKDSLLNEAVPELPLLEVEDVPELPPLSIKDMPEIETGNPDDFFHLIANMFNKPKSSSGMIWNSFEELEDAALLKCHEVFRVRQFVIGPSHKYFQVPSSSSLISQDKNSISWLDKQEPNSVLYISFGSTGMINEADFLEIAWGLANSKQPFLWVIRPGSVLGSEWLEHLPNEFYHMAPERGCIVKWAPQLEVLAHPATGGFWTHCGWNSTLESISEGVPLICWPFFGDQKINARYATDVWKIGIHLEHKLERGEIEKAIKRLMVGTEGKEIRERIMCLKEKVDICLNKGGSSYQSLHSLVSYILSF